jgi:hypothetical protein
MDKYDYGYFGFILGLLACLIIFRATNTEDSEIKSGSKIKIQNAVYKCEKIDELDLK